MSEASRFEEGTLAKQYLEAAATLYAAQVVAAKETQERSAQAYGALGEAHLLLSGVIGAALLRVNGKIRETSPEQQHRETLFSAFVVGLDVCERAIGEGRYLQAMALLRQELEVIAQLTSIKAGRYSEKRQANVAVLDESLSRLYGQLSEAAHASSRHAIRMAVHMEMSGDDLPGPTAGTRYFPSFDADVARRAFCTHLRLMLSLIEQMSADYSQIYEKEDRFNSKDADALRRALALMQSEGLIEPGGEVHFVQRESTVSPD